MFFKSRERGQYSIYCTVFNLQHELLQILQDFYSALLENMIALRRFCI